MRDRDLTARYEARFEVEDSDEWTVAMVEYNREADAITAALFRAHGEGVGAPLPHGSARLRPPDGARPTTLLRTAERRARRLSGVEGHHRLIPRRVARSAQGVLQPFWPVTQPVALVLVPE